MGYKTTFRVVPNDGQIAQALGNFAIDNLHAKKIAVIDEHSTDPLKYISYLQNTEYKGVTGEITFDTKGDIKDGAVQIYTYKPHRQ